MSIVNFEHISHLVLLFLLLTLKKKTKKNFEHAVTGWDMTTFSKASELFYCHCSTETSSFQVCIKVPVGELIKGTTMNENEFTTQQKKLTGMTESTVMCTIKPSLMNNDQSLLDCVLQTAFMNRSPSPAAKDPDTKIYRFAPLLFYWLNFTFHMRRKDLFLKEADNAVELTNY